MIDDEGSAAPPPNTLIDPLVRPRGLPIHVPQNLATVVVSSNLPKFYGTKDEDPSRHMERYVERLASSLITDPGYCLVWFPTTLEGEAYEWYRDHSEGHFGGWDQMQREFLNEFRPEVGQGTALRALASLKQGREEEISAYIRRFDLVCARFVGTMLNDDTLRQFFIQGFFKAGTIRGVLERSPQTLAEAKMAAREMESGGKTPTVDPNLADVEKRLNASQVGFQETMMKQMQINGLDDHELTVGSSSSSRVRRIMKKLGTQRRKVGFDFGQRPSHLRTFGVVILEDAIAGSLAKTTKFNLNSRSTGQGSHAPWVPICARERDVRASKGAMEYQKWPVILALEEEARHSQATEEGKESPKTTRRGKPLGFQGENQPSPAVFTTRSSPRQKLPPKRKDGASKLASPESEVSRPNQVSTPFSISTQSLPQDAVISDKELSQKRYFETGLANDTKSPLSQKVGKKNHSKENVETLSNMRNLKTNRKQTPSPVIGTPTTSQKAKAGASPQKQRSARG
ncbi:hypothetical protein AXG93_1217s1410 [Marchantia polymorpha subsp. ruderalis]|uniref:Retrotransposon gag domain-containing protein n=1 Tax=Marchantia polymorpha subsp. ruderalis TaxID=1480154 RepID=A0A176VSY8_MARPO|nr:hypothetical protein AXG93_1217s1410 [Marchantia polymorpha subsp. ruderalis]